MSFGKFEGATQAEVFTVIGPLLGGDQSIAAVSKLTYKNGSWTVDTLNDSSYVEAGAN